MVTVVPAWDRMSFESHAYGSRVVQSLGNMALLAFSDRRQAAGNMVDRLKFINGFFATCP